MQDVEPKFVLTALKRGVRHKQLMYDFHTNPPESLSKAYEKVRLTIAAEEREAELTKNSKRQRDDRHEDGREEGRTKKRGESGGMRYEPKFHHYTHLTAPPRAILQVMERQQRLP
jgi:hypothetical protein